MMIVREQNEPQDGAEPVGMKSHHDVHAIEVVSSLDASAEEARFQRVMAIGRKVMSDHHAVLVALAK